MLLAAAGCRVRLAWRPRPARPSPGPPHRADAERQPRVRGDRRLRGRRPARRADATARPPGRRGDAVHQLQRRGRVHSLPLGARHRPHAGPLGNLARGQSRACPVGSRPGRSPWPRCSPTPGTTPRSSASGTWATDRVATPPTRASTSGGDSPSPPMSPAITERVGFDPEVAKVPHLLEGKRGESVREVEPYTLENRPLIDERIAEKSIAYIREHAGGERPFFLFVSWSLVHHPYLPHPDFEGRSGNGPFCGRHGRARSPRGAGPRRHRGGRHRRRDAGRLRQRQRTGLGLLPPGVVLGPLPRLSRQRLRRLDPDADDGPLARKNLPRKGQQRDRGHGRPLSHPGEDRGRGGSRRPGHRRPGPDAAPSRGDGEPPPGRAC